MSREHEPDTTDLCVAVINDEAAGLQIPPALSITCFLEIVQE
jgi:hypothetical protein